MSATTSDKNSLEQITSRKLLFAVMGIKSSLTTTILTAGSN